MPRYICDYCKKETTKYGSREYERKHHFCSRNCYHIYKKEVGIKMSKPDQTPKKVTCRLCGTTIYVKNLFQYYCKKCITVCQLYYHYKKNYEPDITFHNFIKSQIKKNESKYVELYKKIYNNYNYGKEGIGIKAKYKKW